jgi:hypothetical protein
MRWTEWATDHYGVMGQYELGGGLALIAKGDEVGRQGSELI